MLNTGPLTLWKGKTMALEFVIIIFLTIVILCESLFLYRFDKFVKYYRDLLARIVTNEDVVSSSIATTATVYGMSVEDLNNILSGRKKK